MMACCSSMYLWLDSMLWKVWERNSFFLSVTVSKKTQNKTQLTKKPDIPYPNTRTLTLEFPCKQGRSYVRGPPPAIKGASQKRKTPIPQPPYPVHW